MSGSATHLTWRGFEIALHGKNGGGGGGGGGGGCVTNEGGGVTQ